MEGRNPSVFDDCHDITRSKQQSIRPWQLHRPISALSTVLFYANCPTDPFQLLLQSSNAFATPFPPSPPQCKSKKPNNISSTRRRRGCTLPCWSDIIQECPWMKKRRFASRREGWGWICLRSGGLGRRIDGASQIGSHHEENRV